MTRRADWRNERGIALPTVMLLSFAIATIAFTGAIWILNAQLIQKSGARASILNDVAVARLEEGRSRLATSPSVYPATGYVTLDTNAVVRDAAGTILPGLREWTYAGPNGVTSGQYGVFGTIISVVQDSFGNKVVRRLQVEQESFAKYAYFTTVEGNIVFANNDQIRGPVHSNDLIKIDASGATFFDQVTTAQSSIQGQSNGTFQGPPPKKNVPVIPLPTTQAFSSLQTRASAAGMSFAGNTNGNSSGEASLRIEFVALDLNGDLDSTDKDEGFVRIYQDNTRPWYVTAHLPNVNPINADIRRSPNCGAPYALTAAPPAPKTGNPVAAWNTVPVSVVFRTDSAINPAPYTQATRDAANALMGGTNLANLQSRCYLGGDPRLYQQVWPDVTFDGAAWNAARGAWTAAGVPGWIPRAAGIGVPTVNAFTSRPDAAYLWPISREYNKLWQGVIYVSGRVAVSGVISGRVTLASPENIIVADDIRMAVDPGSAEASSCTNILGLFSGDSVLVANNTLNTPQQINSTGTYRTYDQTMEEDIHAVVLALDIFGAEQYDQGPSDAQDCGTSNSGRGCLALTGGIIQNTRGAVGLTSGQGYIKRYTYYPCAASDPPPYFPTTGRFARNRVYEIDPRGFDVAAWFAREQNN